MQSIELQAKSLEEAKQVASEKLGVSPDEVTLTVLEETKGLFGKSNYRVRAEVGSDEPAPAKPKGRVSKAKAKDEPVAEAVVDAEPEVAKPAKKAPARTKAPAKEEATSDDAEESNEPEVEPVASEDDAKKIKGLLEELLEKADLDATVTIASLNGRYVNIEIDGKDTAYLVGKNGEVLNNLQYLLNVMLNRQLANGVRATVDGNHYRSRREEQLSKLAQSIATQVKERGEEAVLDALPAFERRVVHKALVDFTGVTTYSEGEEPNRRVVIAPGA